MSINPIIPIVNLASVSPSGTETPRLNLVIGQRLEGTVLELLTATESSTVKTSDIKSHAVVLQLQNQTVLAKSPIPLPVGQTLKLEVISSQETPVLRVLPNQDDDTKTVQTAMKLALPKQETALALLNNLTYVTKKTQLPIEIRQLAQAFLETLKTPQALIQSESLRQTLQNSGTLLEARLAALVQSGEHPKSVLQEDIKAQLTRLLSDLKTLQHSLTTSISSSISTQESSTTVNKNSFSLNTKDTTPPPDFSKAPMPNKGDNTPTLANLNSKEQTLRWVENTATELARQTSGALSRIELHQLASVPQASDHTPTTSQTTWSFEIPVAREGQIELWQLKIDKEPLPSEQVADPTQAKHRWLVQMAFNLEDLGPMQVRIAIQQDTVSTTWWAEQPETLSLLQEETHTLRQDLSTEGLRVGHIDCFPGNAPLSSQATIRSPYDKPDAILDIQV